MLLTHCHMRHLRSGHLNLLRNLLALAFDSSSGDSSSDNVLDFVSIFQAYEWSSLSTWDEHRLTWIPLDPPKLYSTA